MLCSAVSPLHQNLVFRGVSCACCVCPAIVAVLFSPSVQSSAVVLFTCHGQCLVPVVLVGHLGLSWP